MFVWYGSDSEIGRKCYARPSEVITGDNEKQPPPLYPRSANEREKVERQTKKGTKNKRRAFRWEKRREIRGLIISQF